MKDLVDAHSKLENRSESRLPYFSHEWANRIKGSYDFIGLNHYTTELVKAAPPEKDKPSWSSDSETLRFHDPKWPGAGSPWLKVVPWGLRKLLVILFLQIQIPLYSLLAKIFPANNHCLIHFFYI